MAQVTFDLGDATQTQRIVNACAAMWGYAPTLSDGTANPETKGAFVKRWLGLHIKDTVASYEANTAIGNTVAIGQAARDKANTEITIA